jgi:hypothetical protein
MKRSPASAWLCFAVRFAPFLRFFPLPLSADARLATEGAVALVAVGLQDPLEAFEESLRHLGRATRVVLVEHKRMIVGRSPLHPYVGLALGRLARLLQHLEAGLVALDEVVIEKPLPHQVDQRLHELAPTHHPVRQRGTREVDSDPFEDAFLPVERQGIRVLRDGDEGE